MAAPRVANRSSQTIQMRKAGGEGNQSHILSADRDAPRFAFTRRRVPLMQQYGDATSRYVSRKLALTYLYSNHRILRPATAMPLPSHLSEELSHASGPLIYYQTVPAWIWHVPNPGLVLSTIPPGAPAVTRSTSVTAPTAAAINVIIVPSAFGMWVRTVG